MFQKIMFLFFTLCPIIFTSDSHVICRQPKSLTHGINECEYVLDHREDGPAIENANGSKFWYDYGKLHRRIGPAIIYANGTKKWYRDGKLHRIGGPAIVLPGGTEYWYYKGKLHRRNGPAIIRADGRKEWWVRGKFDSEATNRNKMNK